MKLLLIVVAAVIAIVGFNFVTDLVSRGPQKQAEIAEARADAAIESGQDAVNITTETTYREIERIETVRTIKEEVDNAEDFDSAHAAGSSGLCDNFGVCPAERVQSTDSRPVSGTD